MALECVQCSLKECAIRQTDASYFSVCLFLFLIYTAQMGVGEGKSIGEWFGPNTVAQVLK